MNYVKRVLFFLVILCEVYGWSDNVVYSRAVDVYIGSSSLFTARKRSECNYTYQWNKYGEELVVSTADSDFLQSEGIFLFN